MHRWPTAPITTEMTMTTPGTEQQPGSLAAALAILQTRLPHVGKDKRASVTSQRTGKTHTYDYANLATVSEKLLPLLGGLGLSFTSCPELNDGRLVLRYTLRHISGDKDGGNFPLEMLLPAQATPQQFGSAITYARRYCLCAVTGVAPDDDDDDAQAAEKAARKPRATRASGGSRKLEGDELREHNALRRMNERHDGKLERGITEAAADPEPWASVDANGRRPPQGQLPATYPAGQRQIVALQGHFKRLGYEDHDREERLAITAKLAGAGEIESSAQLTQEQVQAALKKIEKCKDRAALMDRLIEIDKELNPA